MFHVQTEDSGIQNPHLFTHLFHDGVILASKKMVYDPDADNDVVKGLMQAQHKSVLKELKGGKFDDKIRQYLGDPPPAEDRASSESDYADVQVEGQGAAPPPASVAPAASAKPTASVAPATASRPGPTTGVGRNPLAAAAANPAGRRTGSTAPPPPDPASDVSAAFRAISHASAQVPAVTSPPSAGGAASPGAAKPTTRPPEGAPPKAAPGAQGPAIARDDEASRMVFGADPGARVPPGRGVFAGRPEITQERPFDKSGSFPAVTPPGNARSARPSLPVPPQGAPARSPGSTPPAGPPRGAAANAAGTSGAAGVAKPPTTPPGGSRPTPVRSPGSNPPGGPPPSARPAAPSTGRPVGPPPAAATAPAQTVRPKAPAAPPVGGAPPTRRPATATVPPPQAPTGRPVPGAPNVIVARPAVIVGGPSQVVSGGPRPGTGRPRESPPPPGQDNIFGKDLISEKSLDEVIMAYLSEDPGEE